MSTTLAVGSQTGMIGPAGSGYPLSQNLKVTTIGMVESPSGSCTFVPAGCSYTDTYTGLTGNLTGSISGETIAAGSTLTLSGSGTRTVTGCFSPPFSVVRTTPASISLVLRR